MGCWSSPYQNLIHSLGAEVVRKTIEDIFQKAGKGLSLKDEFHVSLLYGGIECTKLKEEMKKLYIKLPDRIHFNEARIIELGERVKDWKTIAKKKIYPTV